MPHLRNSMKVPDSWVGGPNRWSREERDKWNAFCLNPKGSDPEAGTGSRGRPVSHGTQQSSVDELYDRMVARGIVTAELALMGRELEQFSRSRAKPKKRGRK